MEKYIWCNDVRDYNIIALHIEIISNKYQSVFIDLQALTRKTEGLRFEIHMQDRLCAGLRSPILAQNGCPVIPGSHWRSVVDRFMILVDTEFVRFHVLFKLQWPILKNMNMTKTLQRQTISNTWINAFSHFNKISGVF